MSYDYVIIGGGCYGSYYVRQLVEARDRGKLEWSRVAVLDRDPTCAVASMNVEGVDVVETSWTEFGPTAFADPERWMDGQLVPAPIAPHILMHWLADDLRERHAVKAIAWPDEAPAELPFSNVAENGALVLSWAPGLCPTNCVEPRKCPLTKSTRNWEMSETVREAGAKSGLQIVEAFVCQHHAYGVGTIDFASVKDALVRLRRLDVGDHPVQVGIATVSSCHGLMDVLEISGRAQFS